MMGLKITFINPNSRQEADKYLPKILAAAVLNRITESRRSSRTEAGGNEKHLA